MRKILLTFLFCLFCSTAHALTPQYLCTTATTWAASNWVLSTANQASCTGGTAPTAGDEATLNSASGSVTVGANATTAGLDMTGYTGTLTINSSVTLTISAADPLNIHGSFAAGSPTTSIITTSTGTTTLLATPTGASFPQLNITGTGTLASGGFIWPGAMKISEAGSVTLTAASTWQNNGLTTISAAVLLTPSSATLKCNGGFTISAAMSASSVATINVSGGTLTGSGGTNYIYGPLVLGTVTLSTSNSIAYAGSSITLTGGSTISSVANSIFFYMVNSLTLTSNGVVFPVNLQLYVNSGNTLTLGDDASLASIILNPESFGTFTFTLAGAHNLTLQNLEIDTSAPEYGTTLNLVAGQTLTVTNGLYITGLNSNAPYRLISLPSPYTSTIAASSSSNFNYTGTLANESVYGAIFTNINASGSTYPIYNYGGTASLSTDTNIINVDASYFATAAQAGYIDTGTTISGIAGTLTLPAASDVWHTASAYGVAGSGTTPTKVASSITNCSVGNVKSGVTIDDVVGTYTGSGGSSGFFVQ